jgi:hypothetical protein
MKRYLEAFFRNPWLHVLPLAIMLAVLPLVVNRTLRSRIPYSSDAVVAVNLDPMKTTSVGERPPAEQYAGLLGELMDADPFVLNALKLTTPEEELANLPEPEQAAALRSRWKQAANGPNTLQVSFSCREPRFCADFIAAVLNNFRDQVSAARLAPKTAAVEFYQQQVQVAEDRVRNIPPTDPGRDAARQTYETMLTRLLDAGAEEAQAARSGRDDFKILAPPEVPAASDSPLRAVLLPIVLGLGVGVCLAAGSVALAAWRDTSLRSADEVTDRLGLPVVGIVPANYRFNALLSDPELQPAFGGANAPSPAGGRRSRRSASTGETARD